MADMTDKERSDAAGRLQQQVEDALQRWAAQGLTIVCCVVRPLNPAPIYALVAMGENPLICDAVEFIKKAADKNLGPTGIEQFPEEAWIKDTLKLSKRPKKPHR